MVRLACVGIFDSYHCPYFAVFVLCFRCVQSVASSLLNILDYCISKLRFRLLKVFWGPNFWGPHHKDVLVTASHARAVGNNFFLDTDCVGQLRAKHVTNLLLEMNGEVCAQVAAR